MPDMNLAVADADETGEAAHSNASLLGCLVIAARHRGLHLSVPQLIHDHMLGPGEPSSAQLLRIAQACGLRASATRLGWRDLPKLIKVLPAIVMLRNGSAMVLQRVDARGQPPSVTLLDPNAGEDAPLMLDEGRFTAAST